MIIAPTAWVPVPAASTDTGIPWNHQPTPMLVPSENHYPAPPAWDNNSNPTRNNNRRRDRNNNNNGGGSNKRNKQKYHDATPFL